MERTPQHRNRYTAPAQPSRGRDFRTFVRQPDQSRGIPPQPSAQLPQAAQEPYGYRPTVTTEQSQQQHAIQTAARQPHDAFEHAGLPIQFPQQTSRQHIVAAPAQPPQWQPPEEPIYQPAPPAQAQPPLQQQHQQHQAYLPDEPPRPKWAPPPDDPEIDGTDRIKKLHFAKLRNKFNNSFGGLKTYYTASPKRAAFIAGSSLLVLSAIGWTLAMQSNSANELLAKTPFGFLLIKQGHTKGEQVVIYEEKPTSEEIANYRTEPSKPRYMSIPKFNLFARVLALESKDEGIELPENIYDVGWSTQSNQPLDPQGTQLYIGHAKGITKADAAFSRLGELKEGDELSVETGDGKKYTYVVMHTEKANVSSPNISRYYNSWILGEPGLNLLTTSGVDPTKENPSENRYATFAVFTVLKK